MSVPYISSRFSWLIGLAALFLIVALPGCDSAGSDSATFTLDPVTFEFPPFDASNIQNGEVELSSEGSVDLSSALRNFGFNKSEVTSAKVTRVVLVRQSIGTTSAEPTRQAVERWGPKVFDFLNEAEVRLTASNLSAATIASKVGGFSSTLEGETVLDLNGQDVAGYVKASSIGTRLRLRLDDPGTESYRVEVEVTFQVTGQL